MAGRHESTASSSAPQASGRNPPQAGPHRGRDHDTAIAPSKRAARRRLRPRPTARRSRSQSQPRNGSLVGDQSRIDHVPVPGYAACHARIVCTGHQRALSVASSRRSSTRWRSRGQVTRSVRRRRSAAARSPARTSAMRCACPPRSPSGNASAAAQPSANPPKACGGARHRAPRRKFLEEDWARPARRWHGGRRLPRGRVLPTTPWVQAPAPAIVSTDLAIAPHTIGSQRISTTRRGVESTRPEHEQQRRGPLTASEEAMPTT